MLFSKWATLVSISLYVAMLFSQDVMMVAYVLLGLSLFTSYIYHKLVQTISKVAYKEIVVQFFKVLIIALFFGGLSLFIVTILGITLELLKLFIGGLICLGLYGLYLKKYEMQTIELFIKRKIS